MRNPQNYPSYDHLRRAARRRLPRFAYDYVDGGTGPEVGLRRNREALDAVTLVPRYVTDWTPVEMEVEVFGQVHDRPFGIAPMGLGGLMCPDAELHFARAARAAGIPVGLSTACTVEIEDFGREAGGKGWFQLYPPKDEEVNDDLLRRAEDAGCSVAFVTVDVPVRGWRPRDMYNGLSVPPRFTPRTFCSAAVRPRWSLETLLAGMPRFRTLGRYAPDKGMFGIASYVTEQLGNAVTVERLQRIRDRWKGELVLKGVMHPADAEAAIAMGYSGILVSNHGGRQLDAAPAPIEVLPEIVEVVGGRATVMIDSGFTSGLDIIRAYALGASFVFCGRIFMWGVSALGRAGPGMVADMLTDEVSLALTQIGCPRLGELDASWLGGI